jgi:hypothetical protein
LNTTSFRCFHIIQQQSSSRVERPAEGMWAGGEMLCRLPDTGSSEDSQPMDNQKSLEKRQPEMIWSVSSGASCCPQGNGKVILVSSSVVAF